MTKHQPGPESDQPYNVPEMREPPRDPFDLQQMRALMSEHSEASSLHSLEVAALRTHFTGLAEHLDDLYGPYEQPASELSAPAVGSGKEGAVYGLIVERNEREIVSVTLWVNPHCDIFRSEAEIADFDAKEAALIRGRLELIANGKAGDDFSQYDKQYLDGLAREHLIMEQSALLGRSKEIIAAEVDEGRFSDLLQEYRMEARLMYRVWQMKNYGQPESVNADVNEYLYQVNLRCGAFRFEPKADSLSAGIIVSRPESASPQVRAQLVTPEGFAVIDVTRQETHIYDSVDACQSGDTAKLSRPISELDISLLRQFKNIADDSMKAFDNHHFSSR